MLIVKFIVKRREGEKKQVMAKENTLKPVQSSKGHPL